MAYSGVFVFGDSLVDAGNALKLAEFADDLPFTALPEGAPTASQGYYMGRFTNGFTFADLISNKFISAETKPVFPFGYDEPVLGLSLPFQGDPSGSNLNFAYGGAQIRKGDEAVPDLDDQTDAYRDAVDGHADPNALHLVTIGSNDVRELVPATGAVADRATALSRLDAAAEELNEEIGQLVAIGARNIVVTGIPDLGIIPRYNDAPDEGERRAAVTEYAQLLDTRLQSEVQQLQAANPAAAIHYVDLVDATSTIVANLEKVYGPDLYPLEDSEIIFFDTAHPTVQVHALLAGAILDSINGASAGERIALEAPDHSSTGSIDAAGDTDSVVISLAAGVRYTIELLGISSGSGSLADTVLRISDPAGAEVAVDDDGGLGLDASLTFTAGETGDHVITLAGAGNLAGSYRLQASGEAVGDTLYRVSTEGALILERAGEGNDTALASVSYALAAGVSVETLGTSPESGTDSLDLGGNELNQRIIGNAGANVLQGGAGADSIAGGEGNDHLYGGGSTVTAGDGADVIEGLGGSDYIQGNAGADRIDGGSGNDRGQGGADADMIRGGAGDDSLNGNKGNDSIEGEAGNDLLRGGQGDDLVAGGDGDDILSGDLGVDILRGGAGADIFLSTGPAASPGTGADRIIDYVDGVDRLSIGYVPAALLVGAGQASLSAASAAAQMLFDANPGTAEVAAIAVGSDSYIFYSSNAGPVADSALLVEAVGTGAFSLGDFIGP